MTTVLHICPYLYAAAGGPVTVLQAYLKHEPEEFNFKFLSISPPNTFKVAPYFKGLEPGRVVLIPRCILHFGHLLRSLWAAIKLIKQSSVVHIHGVWHPIHVVFGLVALLIHKPIVRSPHGMLDPYSFTKSPLIKRIYFYLLELQIFRFSHAILYTSAAEKMKSFYNSTARQSYVIELGVDNFFSDSKLPYDVDSSSLLYLGRIHPKKGFHFLPQLLADLTKRRDVHLHVIGHAEGDYALNVKKEFCRLGLSTNVTWHGLKEGDELWRIASRCAIFVLPSEQENFGLAIVECMLAGIPVVVSDKVDLAQLIHDNKVGVVVPFSNNIAWVEAIDWLLANSDQRNEFSVSGKKFVSERFGWRNQMDELVSIYQTAQEI